MIQNKQWLEFFIRILRWRCPELWTGIRRKDLILWPYW